MYDFLVSNRLPLLQFVWWDNRGVRGGGALRCNICAKRCARIEAGSGGEKRANSASKKLRFRSKNNEMW
jgi:hypothetical protein